MRWALLLAALAAWALVAGACTCRGGDGGMDEHQARPRAEGIVPPVTVVPVTAIRPYPPPEPASAPTIPPPPPAEQELLQAYARYWELYAGALLALDGSRLGEVMTGPRLERAEQEIELLTLSGHAVRIDVESAPIVGMLDGEEAVIIDRYRNQSYLVDAETGRPVAARGVANTVHATVSLVLEEGAWKVRDSLREEASR